MTDISTTLLDRYHECKAAHPELFHMALFAELNPAPVFSFNADGVVVSGNDAARSLFDMTPDHTFPVTALSPVFEELDTARVILHNEIVTLEAHCKDDDFQFTIRGISALNLGHVYGSKVTERKRQEEAMRLIVEGTSRATGENFSRSLAYHLASVLQVKYAAVAESVNRLPLHSRILTMWDGTQFHEGSELCLSGTPGAEVVGKKMLLVEEGLQQAFPDDTFIRKHGIESYWGIPMFNSFQECIGHLFVMDTRPIKKARWSESILKIFAARAASELERENAEWALRESEETYRELSDLLPQTVFELDLEGNASYVNRHGLELFGIGKEHVARGLNIAQFVAPADRELFVRMLRRTPKEDDRSQHEYLLQRMDGSTFPALLSWTQVVKGKTPVGWRGVLIDISERKKTELELHAAREAAESASRAKSAFLANMSHEIRTPMNAILGMAHVAMKTALSPKQRDYLSKIHRSAHNLLELLNDVLNFSQIETGKLQLESVDFNLDDVLDNLAGRMSSTIQEKNLELLFHIAPDVPQQLIGDPIRFGEVLAHLTQNAVKFSDDGDIVVQIALGAAGQQCRLNVSVKDDGIGMSEEQQAGLFRSFTQVDDSISRKYGGTGLGLAICKRLVLMMGGDISIESRLNEGTTARFSVVLDCPETTVSRIVPTSLRGMNVLVADDNARSREILRDMLSAFSCQVTLCRSGREALQRLQQAAETQEYPIVLLDYDMPDLNGCDTLREIQAQQGLLRGHYLLLCSLYETESVLQKATRLGFDAVLYKPLSPSALLASLRQVLGEDTSDSSRVLMPGTTKEEVLARIHGAKILVLEDDELNSQVLVELLEHDGFKVVLAQNVADALQAVTAQCFDLALLSLDLSGEDALTFSQEIRQSERNAVCAPDMALPLIAMTADVLSETFENARAAGMHDRITKPIDPDQLLRLLMKWILPQKETGEQRDACDDSPHGDGRLSGHAQENMELLAHFLAQLKPHLRLRKPKKCEPILEKFCGMSWPPAFQEEIHTLCNSVRSYKFSVALKILADLETRLH